MRQLYINDKLAVMSESDNFTLHRENPYFTNSGDYTFEVSLPMEGCAQNQQIFDSLHRMETSAAPYVGKKYDFRLIVPPLSLSGKAIITSISEADIRVQLLAGTSGFNADTIEERGKDIYIDEMNLGKAYEKTFPDAYQHDDHMIVDYVVVTPRSYLIQDLFDNADPKIAYGNINETECVNFPIWSEADQKKSNNKALDHFEDYNANFLRPNVRHIFAEPFFAAQPFLVNIIERIITQLGYHVRHNSIRGTWMENIFIANGKSEYYYNRILPHWTVKEFFEEVRNFFGVFFVADGKEVDILTKNDYYSAPSEFTIIKDVIDEYTVELNEDDDSHDVSIGNVAYEFPSEDSIMNLPEEVWENAIIVKKPNEQILLQWIQQNIKEEDKPTSAWVFVDEETDRCFAYLLAADDSLYHFQQVNICPPLIRRGDQYGKAKRDIDISLRIVPAKMSWHNIDYNIRDSAGKSENYDKAVSLPMLQTDTTREGYLNKFSVDAVINEFSQTENNQKDLDCIEVALATGETFRTSFTAAGQQLNIDVPMAIGIGFVKWDDGLWHEIVCRGNQHQFNLTNKKAPSIQNSVLNSKFKIDTRCKHLIEFVDDGLFSPNSVYLIKGKKYACEKIEYSVGADGIDKKKKGHFYEIG